MDVVAENLSKKFSTTWLFQHVTITFRSGHTYAITGTNGSGKTTLLKIIAGYMAPSSGNVFFHENEKTIPAEQHYQKVSMAAPYLDLVEDFSLREMMRFHFTFTYPGFTTVQQAKLIDTIGLTHSIDKPVKLFSSGMKQKLKLALAIANPKPLLLLDEPTTNLDAANKEWYREFLLQHAPDKTIIICSNQPEEYDFCAKEVIKIEDFQRR